MSRWFERAMIKRSSARDSVSAWLWIMNGQRSGNL